MRAFVITLVDDDYSVACAERCMRSGFEHGVDVERFEGTRPEEAYDEMESARLHWRWAENNTEVDYCEYTGLRQHPYSTRNLANRIGCSMSHFRLWRQCVGSWQPILILEHDAVFLRPLPEFDFKGICQINDPRGATRRGAWWSDFMITRATEGVHPKTWVTNPQERKTPDGLAGNSAYVIKPEAACDLMNAFDKYGVWPNDATMCQQLFPYLEEYYPFITRVEQERSTTSS